MHACSGERDTLNLVTVTGSPTQAINHCLSDFHAIPKGGSCWSRLNVNKAGIDVYSHDPKELIAGENKHSAHNPFSCILG